MQHKNQKERKKTNRTVSGGGGATAVEGPDPEGDCKGEQRHKGGDHSPPGGGRGVQDQA